MTAMVALGALVGVGVVMVLWAALPRRTNLAVAVGRFDASRRAEATSVRPLEVTPWRWRIGVWAQRQVQARGWTLASLRADLALLDRPVEVHLAGKVVAAAMGLMLVPLSGAVALISGETGPLPVTVGGALLLAGLGFVLPDVQVKREARTRRREFVYALVVFYDNVAMNIAGGRAITQALPAAAGLCDHWVFHRLYQTVVQAERAATTPWRALGDLGRRVGIAELEELEGALVLVADDGAKVKDSLVARTNALRAKRLTDQEGVAGEKESSMIPAQFLLVGGYMVMLMYPALKAVLQL